MRRYCLACSARTGRLVERVSPALDRQRALAAERSRAKGQRKRDRERADLERRYVVDGIDMIGAMSKAMRLPSLAPLRKRLATWYMTPRAAPEFVLRRTDRHADAGGHAYNDYRVTMTVGRDCNAARAVGVLLHELAHLGCLAAGEPWNDADRAFANRCHDLHDEWNRKHGSIVTVDDRVSGAYRGSIGRARRKGRD